MTFTDLLPVLIATSSAIVYFHTYIEITKEKIINQLKERTKELELENEQIRDSLKKLQTRYNARGIRIKEAFTTIKESHIQRKADIENLWKTVYDVKWDIDEIYKINKMNKRERRMTGYTEFREQYSHSKPDFDTLPEIENIETTDDD